MRKKNNDFISLIKSNDEKSIREFIVRNGKKPKPICPFYIEWVEEKGENTNGYSIRKGYPDVGTNGPDSTGD